MQSVIIVFLVFNLELIVSYHIILDTMGKRELSKFIFRFTNQSLTYIKMSSLLPYLKAGKVKQVIWKQNCIKK